jgi:hypothetical protein
MEVKCIKFISINLEMIKLEANSPKFSFIKTYLIACISIFVFISEVSNWQKLHEKIHNVIGPRVVFLFSL